MTENSVQLTRDEKVFVERRGRFARSWPVVGSFMLVIVFAFAGWLWLTAPYLVNPRAVAAGLEEGSIQYSTVLTMAALLPVIMLVWLLVVVAVLALSFAAFSNERKLLAIIHRLAGEPEITGERKEEPKR